MRSPLSAKAALNIGITAQGSQQLVIGMLILAAGSLATGFYFQWHDRSAGLPVLVGIALILGAVYCHSKSRPALDRASAGKTKLSRDDKGVKIETDAVTLADPDAAAGLERLLTLSHRRPLPAPDGIVGQGLTVDTTEAGRAKAQQWVNEANEAGKEQLRKSIELLANSSAGVPVLQPRISEPADVGSVGLNEPLPD